MQLVHVQYFSKLEESFEFPLSTRKTGMHDLTAEGGGNWKAVTQAHLR